MGVSEPQSLPGEEEVRRQPEGAQAQVAVPPPLWSPQQRPLQPGTASGGFRQGSRRHCPVLRVGLAPPLALGWPTPQLPRCPQDPWSRVTRREVLGRGPHGLRSLVGRGPRAPCCHLASGKEPRPLLKATVGTQVLSPEHSWLQLQQGQLVTGTAFSPSARVHLPTPGPAALTRTGRCPSGAD